MVSPTTSSMIVSGVESNSLKIMAAESRSWRTSADSRMRLPIVVEGNHSAKGDMPEIVVVVACVLNNDHNGRVCGGDSEEFVACPPGCRRCGKQQDGENENCTHHPSITVTWWGNPGRAGNPFSRLTISASCSPALHPRRASVWQTPSALSRSPAPVPNERPVAILPARRVSARIPRAARWAKRSSR